MEAAGGLEPPNKGFADLCLSHLATPPWEVQSSSIPLSERVEKKGRVRHGTMVLILDERIPQ